MKRFLKALARLVRVTILIVVCAVFIPTIIALGRAGVECRAFGGNPPAAQRPEADTAPEIRQIKAGLSGYARNEDQTYLTLPEWYIVYSADEYAAFIAQNPPSQFPYFGAIGQFWRSYYDVCAITRDQYAFNSGYHLSLAVIGSSFTAENILKGIYENTLGRLTEWTSSSELTEEDAYARKVAAEYGTFLHTIPWYEFPFWERLKGLWSETSLSGPNAIRKWERKIALSLEYGTKAIYGWVIKQGTQGVYSAEDLEILAWAEGVSDQALKQEPQVRVVKAIDAQAAIVAIPRYEAFTQIVPRLARQGVRFIEIAGNDDILITVIAPRNWKYDLKDGTSRFTMPILTHTELKRVAVNVPVRSLHSVLNELESRDVELEHIYDY